MLTFTVVLLELGMWARTVQAEQSNVKLFFRADTVGSIVTSGLQGVKDYVVVYMEQFKQGRSCVDNRLLIVPLLLLVCHTTYLSS